MRYLRLKSYLKILKKLKEHSLNHISYCIMGVKEMIPTHETFDCTM